MYDAMGANIKDVRYEICYAFVIVYVWSMILVCASRRTLSPLVSKEWGNTTARSRTAGPTNGSRAPVSPDAGAGAPSVKVAMRVNLVNAGLGAAPPPSSQQSASQGQRELQPARPPDAPQTPERPAPQATQGWQGGPATAARVRPRPAPRVKGRPQAQRTRLGPGARRSSRKVCRGRCRRRP